jgi:hypothetical protein
MAWVMSGCHFLSHSSLKIYPKQWLVIPSLFHYIPRIHHRCRVLRLPWREIESIQLLARYGRSMSSRTVKPVKQQYRKKTPSSMIWGYHLLSLQIFYFLNQLIFHVSPSFSFTEHVRNSYFPWSWGCSRWPPGRGGALFYQRTGTRSCGPRRRSVRSPFATRLCH